MDKKTIANVAFVAFPAALIGGLALRRHGASETSRSVGTGLAVIGGAPVAGVAAMVALYLAGVALSGKT